MDPADTDPQAARTTAPPKDLAAVAEQDENSPEAAPENRGGLASPPPPKTPAASSAVRPPMSEMHPSKVHASMADAPSTGLRLGFTDINPESVGRSVPSGMTQTTPSRRPVPVSPFDFRYAQPAADLGLSSEAQKLMDELRGDALKIKADLLAQREEERKEKQLVGQRKIAQPKGRAGRFSAVHMAEFKKMDSIENHPSAFRAQPGRFTPVTKGLKRTQSKANLDDDPEPARAKDLTPAPSPKKHNPLFGEGSKAKTHLLFDDEPVSAAKRVRQHIEDDASSSRPISRDGSFLPRPTTAGKDSSGIPRSRTMASIMTPTKSSLARAANAKPPGTTAIPKSVSKTTWSGLKKSATTNNFKASETDEPTVSVTSPGRFDRVKSMLRGRKTSAPKGQSTLPVPAVSASKALSPLQLDKPLPRIPSTTPRRKLQKRPNFTPSTVRATESQISPSAPKSAIPRSKTRRNLDVDYPTLDTVLAGGKPKDAVQYPDLSSHGALFPQPPLKDEATKPMPTAPGTFTFRSDHTICFDSTSPSGFGSSPGQASLRHVRPSIRMTMAMPGSFPVAAATSGSDKENRTPIIPGAPHGIFNKKRHRVSADEDEVEEAEERAAKKRKNNPAAEGDALLAPRLTGMHGSPVEIQESEEAVADCWIRWSAKL